MAKAYPFLLRLRGWLCPLSSCALVSFLVLSALSQAQEAAETWKAVFPEAEIHITANLDTRASRFLDTVRKHSDLLELLPVGKSPARVVTILPSDEYPADDPTFLYQDQVLLVGPLRTCESGHPDAYVVFNLHEFAHSIFAANLYATFGLDPRSAFAGRYDPAAFYHGHREQELSRVVPYGDLVAPFAEVFADAFAVLAVDDPSAISRALRECGHDGARNFAGSYEADHWNGGDLKPFYLPRPRANPYEPHRAPVEPAYFILLPDLHDVLAPLRKSTWDAYAEMKSQNVSKPGAVTLAALHCAAATVAKNQRDAGMTYRSWFAISKPEYNEVAIAAFRKCVENLQEARG